MMRAKEMMEMKGTKCQERHLIGQPKELKQ